MRVMKRRIPKAFSYSVFYEQAPEGGYVAFVPALPGCHTQGENLEETERNVKEAIALYLESLEHFRSKCKPPKPLPSVAALQRVCELGANSEPRPEEAVYVISETGLAAHGEAIPEESQSFQGRVTVPASVPL
jgi:predicted RNase H-like HicB family nuclease